MPGIAGQRRVTPASSPHRAPNIPTRRIVAGGTDVGAGVTKQHRDLGDDDLRRRRRAICARVETTPSGIEIGAAVSADRGVAALARQLARARAKRWRRFASLPIRNSGTLGGNIANGSPIGDSMPALIALGATLVLRTASDARGRRSMRSIPATARPAASPANSWPRVRVPRRAAGARAARLQDQQALRPGHLRGVRGFALMLDGGPIATARIGFGGVAATPARATATEAVLVGSAWTRGDRAAPRRELERDSRRSTTCAPAPRTGARCSRNLLRRFCSETGERAAPTRVDSVQATEAAR